MDRPEVTSLEAGKALDALTALSHQLSCHRGVHPDTLILPARKVHEACSIIDEAVTALKKIIHAVDATGTDPAAPH